MSASTRHPPPEAPDVTPDEPEHGYGRRLPSCPNACARTPERRSRLAKQRARRQIAARAARQARHLDPPT